jgi:hypothetical protein
MEHEILVLEDRVQSIHTPHYQQEHELARSFIQITHGVCLLLMGFARPKNLLGLFNQALKLFVK